MNWGQDPHAGTQVWSKSKHTRTHAHIYTSTHTYTYTHTHTHIHIHTSSTAVLLGAHTNILIFFVATLALKLVELEVAARGFLREAPAITCMHKYPIV
jgi:hypothetical protein